VYSILTTEKAALETLATQTALALGKSAFSYRNRSHSYGPAQQSAEKKTLGKGLATQTARLVTDTAQAAAEHVLPCYTQLY
jgi:hypothetical protein